MMFRCKVAKVSGQSMHPNFSHGDFILAVRWPWLRFCKNQTVLVHHPQYQLIIKRIKHIEGQQCLLVGDNDCSISTEKMGWVQQSAIIGLVCYTVKPA